MQKIYLDQASTSFPKSPSVADAVYQYLSGCAVNVGRGGYRAAYSVEEQIFETREQLRRLFHFTSGKGKNVIFTQNITMSLNILLKGILKPGDHVLVTSMEHNAVMRPLVQLEARGVAFTRVPCAGDGSLSVERLAECMPDRHRAVVMTHASNVGGTLLPIEAVGEFCRAHALRFFVDAAQTAGVWPIDMERMHIDALAFTGHKGLLGPQGTGLLLCARDPEPLMQGGTGSLSIQQDMPDFLPDRGEAGTVNVPGICGLAAGMAHIQRVGLKAIGAREEREMERAVRGLNRLGLRVFAGPHQAGVLSFLPPDGDCEKAAGSFAARGIALRAGLHCAPTAHESAGTLETGTVRASFGPDASPEQTRGFLQGAAAIWGRNKGPEGARS